MRRWQVLLAVPAVALLLASPASALSITQVGANGGPATDGGAAVATAASADPSNIAIATGGVGGSPGATATSGGEARATAETLTAGASVAMANATGGAGGNGLQVVTGGPGGAAWGSAVAENASSEPVAVSAVVSGGEGGNGYGPGSSQVDPSQDGGAGGHASLGRVYGASSGGGDVSVVAIVAGGNGGDAGETKLAGAGASVALLDAVDGDTTGALFLRQRADAGDSGWGSSSAAGSAESSLTREKSAASLALASEAIAGGWLAFPGVPFPSGSGAGATAEVAGTNHAGSATTRAVAIAGRGADQGPGGLPAVGGEASVRASATTLGDGHAVRVGEDPFPDPNDPLPTYSLPTTGARGGAGGASPGIGVNPGIGGDAQSRSTGTALGDSSVYVFDFALGGSGGGCSLFLSSCQRGADGGGASSQAIGEGAGHSSVEVHALAAGGASAVASDDDSGQTPRGGASLANASASGLGEVLAASEAGIARATSGFGFPGFPASRSRPNHLSGDSTAFATGRGTSGSVASAARASGGPVGQLTVYAGSSIATEANVEAKANAARALPTAGSGADRDVFAGATALPLAEDSQQVLDENPMVEAAFTAAGVDEILALGRFGMRSSQHADADSILLSAGASFEIDAMSFALPGYARPGNVWIAFFAPALTGDGFESLRVRLARNDDSLLDLVFTDPDQALDQLDQFALDLGAILTLPSDGSLPPISGTRHFTVDFDLVVRDLDDSFGVGFLVGSTPIPEPSTLLLFALGLAVLAVRQRRA
jgi:hypothetical protein